MPSSARCRRLPTAHPAQHTPRSVGTHNARKPPPTSDSPAPLNKMGRVRRGLRPQRTAAQEGRRAGLAYVGIIPCDYQIRLPSGAAIRADQAVADAVFERRSCGNGSKGPRYSDWAMTATAVAGAVPADPAAALPPGQLHLLPVLGPTRPPGHHDLLHHHRRAPLAGGETFKTGKDVFGWDQTQVRSRDGICRHTALAALAQLRAAAIRNATHRQHHPARRHRHRRPAPAGHQHRDRRPATATATTATVSDADLQIPLGDAPVPVRGGQPCPPEIGPIKLSIAETTRLAGLAACYTKGLITRARLAFALRWSLRRRLHQARARWHHYSTRLQAVTGTG